MQTNPVGFLRRIGLIEGISFLVLLGVAMPLKYAAGLPIAVKVVGWAHGLLFMLYLFALWKATVAQRWAASRVMAAILAALLPFGTFWLDAKLRQEESAAAT